MPPPLETLGVVLKVMKFGHCLCKVFVIGEYSDIFRRQERRIYAWGGGVPWGKFLEWRDISGGELFRGNFTGGVFDRIPVYWSYFLFAYSVLHMQMFWGNFPVEMISAFGFVGNNFHVRGDFRSHQRND